MAELFTAWVAAMTRIVREAAERALSEVREVNGGELESVLTIYRPEGLAVLVAHEFARAITERDSEPPRDEDREPSKTSYSGGEGQR